MQNKCFEAFKFKTNYFLSVKMVPQIIYEQTLAGFCL